MPKFLGFEWGDDHRAEGHSGVRAPLAATTSTSYLSPNSPIIPSWDADKAIEVAYFQNVFVYAAVRQIGNSIGRLPVRVGADPDKPTSYNRNAPLAKLLGPAPSRPNPAISTRQLLGNAVANYLVTGAFAWEVEWNKGRTIPVGLWPLVIPNLEVFRSDGGSAYFSKYEYRVSQGKNKVLQPYQVVYGWRPSLDDPAEPESPLQSAHLNINTAIMQDRYNYAFLRNDARPAAVVVTEAFASPEDKAKFQSQFRASHQGPDRAGSTAFLEASDGDGEVGDVLKIESLGLSQKDAQALQIYSAQLRAICVALGVPMSMLGDASGRTFDNAGQEGENYWEGTVLPLLEDISGHINRDLAPHLGSDVLWFDTSRVKALQPRRSLQPVDLPTLRKQGDITLNEERSMLDLPAVEGGDDFGLEPEEMSLSDKVTALDTLTKNGFDPEDAAKKLGLPDIKHTGRIPFNSPDNAPGATPPEAMKEQQDKPLPDALQKQAEKLKNGRTDLDPEQRERDIARLSRALAKTMTHVVDTQAKSTMKRFDTKRGRQLVDQRSDNVDAIFSPDFWKAEVRTRIGEQYEWAVGMAADTLRNSGAGLDAQEAANFIGARSEALAAMFTDEVHQAVTRAFLDGIEGGADQEAISASLWSVFTTIRDHIVNLAITEATAAYDAALVALTGVQTATVADLLTKLTNGELNLDEALSELQGAS